MLMILPMKINKIPKGKESLLPSICTSGKYFAELKKDGYWYEYEKSEDGIYLFSSNVSATTGDLVEKSANVPHIIKALNSLPVGTVVVGEIYYPGKTSKDVTPIMGCLPDKAIERQNGEFGPLHYYIHDILFYNGADLREYGAWIRYQLLQKVYFKHGLDQYKSFIELAEAVTDNIESAIHSALDAGEEGMVLKKKTCRYYTGKRSPVWETIKIKKTDTCDAILIGYCSPTKYYDGKLDVEVNYGGANAKEWPYWIIEKLDVDLYNTIVSEKKVPVGEQQAVRGIDFRTMPVTKAYYYGWITSIRIGAFDDNGQIKEIGTVSSGLTEELEADFAQHPTKYIGRVVELAGMEKNNEDHTLRHFYFKNFREDKNANECLLTEIFS